MQTIPMLAPDSFFFMSLYYSLTTSGRFARYAGPVIGGDSPDSPFQQKMNALFVDVKSQGIVSLVMVGAIPFDTRQPLSLFIPQSWQSSPCVTKQQSSRYFTVHQSLNVIKRKSIPEQDFFEDMVARAAALMSTPEVGKVVLLCLIDITTDANTDDGVLLERLVAQNPVSYNLHVLTEDGGVLISASPELLLRKGGDRLSSPPLAGSARRQPDDVPDREAGIRLLASEKDRHEHELVMQAMRAVLRDRSRELQLPSPSQLVTTPTLWHLGTPFEGKANPQENALTLARLLYLTPALSDFPHQAARKLIAELEPSDRELFDGIVGWRDAEDNGEQVVTIRCAKLLRNQVRFLAGAGIVPASSPAAEWRETGVKLSTMLNVFGLHQELCGLALRSSNEYSSYPLVGRVCLQVS